ncbi:MAG: 2-dehydropantoate 2-reductase [Candidatus Omnitrophica bacterium]|nr:2-dehydropantoate 2-reductase [Candidatus Omnitrophota bacterium]
MAPRKKLDILVFGAGAIGSVYGGFLSRFHNVTLLGRTNHIRAIRKRGLRVSGIWGRHVFKQLQLETDSRKFIRQKKHFDLILLTVKSYDMARAVLAIKKLLSPHTAVLALQNGLGNIEILHRALPPKQVFAGRVIFGVEVPKPGEVKVTVIAQPTALGETCRKGITPRLKHLVQVFSETKIPTVACRDIERLIWAKVIYNSSLNPLASLLDCHYGYLGEHQATRQMIQEIIEEIYRVGKKLKVHLAPRTALGYQKVFFKTLLPRTYHHHPSMLQDLQRGKRTEIEALNGAIERLGKRAKIAVPVNALMADLIRQKEA